MTIARQVAAALLIYAFAGEGCYQWQAQGIYQQGKRKDGESYSQRTAVPVQAVSKRTSFLEEGGVCARGSLRQDDASGVPRFH
jgi:hypothetical protein